MTWPRWSSAAYQDPLLREFSTSPGYQVAVGNRTLQYNNTNRLVKNPDWDIGLQKTGYISEAGQCLVMQAKMAGPQADHGVPGLGRQVQPHRRRRARAPLGRDRTRRSPLPAPAASVDPAGERVPHSVRVSG